MAATVVDNVKIKVLSTGTGALILGPAVDGYRGSEALINGNIYNYAIRVGGVYEIGQGTYLSASGSLTRSVKYSSNGDAVVTLPPNCEVSFVALAADLNGTELSAEAIAAANAAINASAQAQDALADIEAVSGPVAALLTDEGASLVLTQSGMSVESSLAERAKASELSAPTGSSQVGFLDRSVSDELLRTVYADHYGVVADYDVETDTGTDDTLAWYRAFNEGLGGGPGRVIMRRGGRSLISGVLHVPHSVTIEAESGRTFMGLDGFDANSGDIYIGPSGKITLGNSSGLRRLVVFRKGIEFNITAAQVATQFQGDAVILRDSTWDHCLEDVVIAGFMNGVQSEVSSGSNQCNRTRFIGRVMIDCQKAVRIYNAFDIPILDALEGWPLVTYASTAEANGEQLKRTGPFVWLHGVNDWTKMHVPFNYGVKIGFRVTDAGSCTFIAAGSDYPYQATPDSSVGFVLDGASWENRLLFPQAAQRDTGIYVVSTSSLMALHIYGANLWECRVNGIAVVQGNVQITGGSIRSSFSGSVGIQTGPAAGNVDVDGVDFRNVVTALANDNNAVKLRHRNCRFTNVTTRVLNPYRPLIASAAAITLNGEDDTFFVTGTTAIGTINNAEAYVGKGPVTFIATSNVSFLDGGQLALAGDFAATNGDVIQLISNGAGWSQVGRSDNG